MLWVCFLHHLHTDLKEQGEIFDIVAAISFFVHWQDNPENESIVGSL